MFNVSYHADFLNEEEQEFLYKTLLHSEDYDDPAKTAILIHGKQIPIPRRQMSFGEKPYIFAGTSVQPKPIPDYLRSLLDKINTHCETEFTHILVNLYRDGTDYIGYHHDKQIHDTPIASVSLGTTRDFLFKKETTIHKYSLTSGSLLVIHPPTNIHWKHSLPKRLKIKSPRINITFRKL